MPTGERLRATTVSVALSSLVVSGALGGTAIVTARALGPAGRGVFAASYSLLLVLVIVGTVGIGPGGRRLLAGGAPAGVNLSEYMVAVRRLVLAHLILAAFGAFVLLPIFGAGRSMGEQVAFVAGCVSTLAMLLARDALFGVGGAAEAELILAVASVSILAAVLVLSAAGQITVAEVLWVYAAAAAVSFLFAYLAALRRVRPSESAVRRSSFRRIVASGRPVLVLLVAQAIATRGDRLVIGAIAGASELGQYAVAVSVMELLSVGAFALANVAFQGLADGSLEPRSMQRALRVTVAGTAVAAVVLAVLAPWLIDVAFGSSFKEAVGPLRVLAFAAVPYGSFQIDTQHLIARNRAKTSAALAMGAGSIMVLGDLVVVPLSGILGAAWVSVVVFSVFALLGRLVVHRMEHARR